MHNFETGNLTYIEQARISKFWQKVDSMSATSASSHNLWLNVYPTLQKHPWFPFWGFPVSFFLRSTTSISARTDGRTDGRRILMMSSSALQITSYLVGSSSSPTEITPFIFIVSHKFPALNLLSLSVIVSVARGIVIAAEHWSCQAVWYQYNSLEGTIAKQQHNFTKKLESYLQI